ncbi:hypothetical protein N7454_005221 [Penicillium verhagenii]|nr:hypothetical protein N7454_005221 [Penicillium verhagenii]
MPPPEETVASWIIYAVIQSIKHLDGLNVQSLGRAEESRQRQERNSVQAIPTGQNQSVVYSNLREEDDERVMGRVLKSKEMSPDIRGVVCDVREYIGEGFTCALDLASKDSIVKVYGNDSFKCPQLQSCLSFTFGLPTADERNKHINCKI